MKSKLFIIVILITFFIIPLKSDIRIDRTRKLVPQEFKVKVDGYSSFLGYMNSSIHLSDINGNPLTGQKVYLNKSLFRDRGRGNYSVGINGPIDLKGGKNLEISILPKSTAFIKFKNESRPVKLGTYRIKNYIEWIYPARNSTIQSFSRNVAKRTIKFRWNYSGPVLKTKIVIRNIKKRSDILTKMVVAEELNVPVDIFNKGEQYSLSFEVVGPMGQFNLTNDTLPGSKIEFFHRSPGSIWFKVK